MGIATMSFRRKTILGIAAIQAVLLLILVGTGLDFMRQSNEQELTKRATTTATLFATTAKDAVLATDLATLESFVQEVMKNPGLVYARVRDRDGMVLAQGGNDSEPDQPFRADEAVAGVTDSVFDTYAEIRVAGTTYGRVELGLSIQEIHEALATARQWASWLAVMEMGLVALFSFVLGTWLTRQLRGLKQAAERVADGDVGFQVPIKGQDELAQTAMAFNDMSQRLRQFNDELEQRVAQRTAELVQTQQQLQADLERRKKMGEELRQEKQQQKELIDKLEQAHNQLLQSEKMASIGQLAAGVAHEINNPVGYINSNLGTLAEYQQDLFQVLDVYESLEPLLQYEDWALQRIHDVKQVVRLDHLRQDVLDLLDESQQGVTRVRQIVADLKDFSHADEGEWAPADLHQGLESTLNIVNNEVKYKAEVVREYGDLPSVCCQAPQLNQVFMNLLVNAAQAIEGHGVITLRTGSESGWVWVEIGDTGQGIAAENLKHIFDPFFTTKPVGSGTGLGLSLSYGIVKAHGGRIEVDSEPGKGTTFRIWLPEAADEGQSTEDRRQVAGMDR
jgi:two-component system, NtrC family, sensor kinase